MLPVSSGTTLRASVSRHVARRDRGHHVDLVTSGAHPSVNVLTMLLSRRCTTMVYKTLTFKSSRCPNPGARSMIPGIGNWYHMTSLSANSGDRNALGSHDIPRDSGEPPTALNVPILTVSLRAWRVETRLGKLRYFPGRITENE